MNVRVTLPHAWRGNRQGEEIFLAASVGKKTQKSDTACLNHHPFKSTLRLKGWSRSKLEWWTISKNVPVNVIVRLPLARREDSQGQETFWRTSAGMKIWNYDTECSNHHFSLLTLRLNGLSCSKMKLWAIYTN